MSFKVPITIHADILNYAAKITSWFTTRRQIILMCDSTLTFTLQLSNSRAEWEGHKKIMAFEANIFLSSDLNMRRPSAGQSDDLMKIEGVCCMSTAQDRIFVASFGEVYGQQ